MSNVQYPNQTLIEQILDFLKSISNLGIELAQERFRELTQLDSDWKIELFWEKVSGTDEIDYEVLCSDEHGSFIIAYCPHRPLPWLLRKATSPHARTVLTVDSVDIDIETVLAVLDRYFRDKRITEAVIEEGILTNEFFNQRSGKFVSREVSDEELDSKMVEWQQQHRLMTIDAVNQFLKERGRSLADVEKDLCRQIVTERMLREIVLGQEKEYFLTHQADFTRYLVGKVSCRDLGTIIDLKSRIEKTQDFFHSILEQMAICPDMNSQLVRKLYEFEIREDQKSLFGSATPGMLVGPFQSGDTYEIVQIFSIEPPTFNAETEGIVRRLLAHQWLEARRRKAVIQWH